MTVGPPRDAAGAATAMEAYFLRRVLAEVHPGDAFTGGGLAGSTFHEMLNEALADEMAEAGGIGLAAQVAEQLGVAPAMLAGARAAGRYAGTGALTEVPVHGTITSGVGMRYNPGADETRMHHGLDIAVAEGTPIRTAGAGRVVRAEVADGYGNLVVVDHGGGLETRYAHLREIGVREGDVVAAGQVVGAAGSTGNSRGPHLHFEVRRDGHAVDPRLEVPGLAGMRHRR